MTNEQSNHYRMFITVQDYLDNRNEVWSPIPKINEYKNELDELIARIAGKTDETKAIVGVKEKKDHLKQVLALKLAGLSGVIQAYANETGNHDLAKAVKVTKSDVGRANDHEVENIANALLKAAGEHLDKLREYGITQEKLTEISTTADDFNALVGKPRSIQNQKYVTLDSIEQLFDECNNLLRNRMDNIMVMFQENSAEFYDGYQRAR
ncbi:MAG: hypothetical protein ACOC0C_08320, partial [Bacteroidota bacterium]